MNEPSGTRARLPADRGVASDAAPDWVRGKLSYVLAWGMPSALFMAAAFAAPPVRSAVWIPCLAWMGTACLINARRCRRVHCFFTGPYFLIMALVVALNGLGILWPGPGGALRIGVVTVLGTVAIWGVSERRWGRYRPS